MEAEAGRLDQSWGPDPKASALELQLLGIRGDLMVHGAIHHAWRDEDRILEGVLVSANARDSYNCRCMLGDGKTRGQE